MLNRNKAPNMGLWNGVGGKIENTETIYESVIRESFEETGITIIDPKFVGTLRWITEKEHGGIYVFIAETTEDWEEARKVPEGILAWKQMDWVLNPNNLGVVSNLPLCLDKMLKESVLYDHEFTYEKEPYILNYTAVLLEESEYKTKDLSTKGRVISEKVICE